MLTDETLVAFVTTVDRFGTEEDDLGLWPPVAGHSVVWFGDPDGRTLCVAGPI
jgi:hypothetical protein